MVIGEGIDEWFLKNKKRFDRQARLLGGCDRDCSFIDHGILSFLLSENTNLLAAWHGLAEHGLLVRDHRHTLSFGPT